jgi:hypothetical protein
MRAVERTGRGWLRLVGLLLAVTVAGFATWVVLATAAGTTPPSLLTQFGERGQAGGQFEDTRSIVADPGSGHLFVVDTTRGVEKTSRVDEFTAWGEFVKAFGWGVRDGSPEPQTCGPGATPPSETCLPGLEGAGAGELGQATGIAIDAAGDLYLYERGNARVQRFTQEGEFILAFGGHVDETTGGDVCTAASGDTCGAGTLGSAPGEFGIENKLGADGNYIGVGPDGLLYVGDKDRIQVFETDGSFVRALPLPEPGWPGALAVDPVSGDVYFSFAQEEVAAKPSPQPDVYRLDPLDGEVFAELEGGRPVALATDAEGDVWVGLDEYGFPEVVEYDSNGQAVIPHGSAFGPEVTEFKGSIRSLATNTVTEGGSGIDLYLGFTDEGEASTHVNVYGPAPDKWPPPAVPPQIDGQYASDVGTTTATLGAEINPRFWDDTRYLVEYGEQPCGLGGCTQVPAPPGESLGAGRISLDVKTAGIEIGGLAPGTEYHYRFVAQSGGGGPVVGEEANFRTRNPEVPNTACPNQEMRSGPSAALADCRAYELVSPVDKADGDIAVQCNIVCYPVRLDQAAAEGGKATYSSYRAFGDAKSSAYSNQYLATRTAGGWVSQAIGPPQEGAPSKESTVLDNQFKAFSPDLSQGWLTSSYEPLLAPGAVPGYQNLYRLDTESGEYAALTTAQPSNRTANEYELELQGFSADGAKAVFSANGKLTADAASKDNATFQLYESEGGGAPELVSLRPNGTAASQGGVVGSADNSGPYNHEISLTGAVSVDGSVIYWSAPMVAGQLYARVEGQETIEVSPAAAEFITATPDGQRAFYREMGVQNLVEFDLATKARTTLASGVLGAAGFSADASRIYFVSSDALAAAAEAGEPNLYLHEAGQPPRYIATLAPGDNASAFDVATIRPSKRATRATPDGSVLVFTSAAPLTGYDNRDVNNGKRDAEVYRYDAESEALACLSCNPTGARPLGADLEAQQKPTGFWAAAYLPGWSTQFYSGRELAEDGNRVFFDATDRLSGRDTNGVQDVYEWEAEGSGDCTTARPEYDAASGGCLSLISGGTDPRASEFIDASSDGSEAFFTTGQSLLAQDPGAVDLYSARVDGGFPPPPSPPAPCEGEACQGPGPQNTPPGSASDSFAGPPNPAPRKHKRHHHRRHRKHRHQHHRHQAKHDHRRNGK